MYSPDSGLTTDCFLQPIPSADALAEIVRFGGSGSDLDRMQDIICSKRLRLSPPIVLDYLRLFLDVQQVDLALLYTLEAALCSVAFYNHRPCAMALALCRVHRRLPEAQLCSLMQLCLVSCDALDWVLEGHKLRSVITQTTQETSHSAVI